MGVYIVLILGMIVAGFLGYAIGMIKAFSMVGASFTAIGQLARMGDEKQADELFQEMYKVVTLADKFDKKHL